MTTYSMEAIKAALTKKTTKTDSGPKLTYWKAVIGEHEIRFLPYVDSTGRPFQEVLYYEKLADRRVTAPCSFGMPDPIKDMFEEKRKTKEGWQIAKHLRPRERYYAVIIVRGEEEKGPQVWEFSKELRDQIFGILTHKDNVDEDMFNPETGYDFTVTVSQATDANGKPRTFNGSVVKSVNVTPRKKPSKLSTKVADAKKWLDAMPNLEESFKKYVKSPEELLELAEAFVANQVGGSSKSDEGTDHNASNGQHKADVDSAFDDIA